jgi:hypothetical protein
MATSTIPTDSRKPPIRFTSIIYVELSVISIISFIFYTPREVWPISSLVFWDIHACEFTLVCHKCIVLVFDNTHLVKVNNGRSQ